MRRYSLLFGIVGILAGLALLFYNNIVLRPETPAPGIEKTAGAQ